MHPRHSLRLVVAALGIAFGAAHGATFVVTGRTHVLPGGPDDVRSAGGQQPVSISVQGSGGQLTDGGEVIVNARANASADMGGVHLWASTSAILTSPSPGHAPVAQAWASGSMGDSFVLQGGGLPHATLVTATLGFYAHGSSSGEALSQQLAESRAQWIGMMSVSGAGGEVARFDASESCYRSHSSPQFYCISEGTGLVTTQVSLYLGTTVQWSIQGNIQSSVNAVGVSSVLSTVDLSHTLAWAGLSDFRDAQGNPVSGLTAISPSTGFNYVMPFASVVPEPGSWALALAGLLAVAGVVRRRR